MSRNSLPSTRILSGAAWVAGFAALAVVSLSIGPARLSPGDYVAALAGGGEPAHRVILWEIRFPRFLAAFLAGAALGASGAGLQGLLRNPLADPGVLGVASAAALGAVTAVYFGLAGASPFATPLFAIGGALAATLALFFLGARRLSTTRLILVGVGLSSFAGAMISLLMNLAPNPFVLSDLVNWLFGSVANRSLEDALRVGPFLAIGFGLMMTSGRALAVLGLGEDTAASLGADLGRLRSVVIAGAALMVGASVALAGAIGFVGVVAPHLARPLVGGEPGRAIAPAALIGGAILALADLIIRLLPFQQEMKLGLVAAFVGAPGFVWIAARTRSLAR